jgi:hypothetical protein
MCSWVVMYVSEVSLSFFVSYYFKQYVPTIKYVDMLCDCDSVHTSSGISCNYNDFSGSRVT